MAKQYNFVRVNFSLNNENYQIDKYNSKSKTNKNVVFLKKEIDGNFDFVEAKRIIREKLAEIAPERYSLAETEKLKYNTRVLGAKLVKLLGV